jgi:hypothetical protein
MSNMTELPYCWVVADDLPPTVTPLDSRAVKLQEQLEYAEEIIRRLCNRSRTCRQCFTSDYTYSLTSDVPFEDRLTKKMAELYLAGAKTPAEFVKAQAGEKP